MPLAHGIVAPGVELNATTADAVVTRWAALSGENAEHMTVTLSCAECQAGTAYRVMATLLLPSMWPADKQQKLQEALAQSLAEACACSAHAVHVITTVIGSGQVVENGQTRHWPD